jgi:signal transduction histidine kinase
MKPFIAIPFILLLFWEAKGQQVLPDSLKIPFQQAQNDSVKFKTSRAIYTFYEETNRDSALYYARLRYSIAKKYNRKIEEAHLQGQMAYQQIYLGRFSDALANLTEAIQIANESKDADTWELTAYNTPGKNRQVTLSMINHMLGHLKLQTGSNESIFYFKEGRRIGVEIGNAFRVTVACMVLGVNYLQLNQPDSALLYAKEGEVWGIRGNIPKYLSNIYSVMGDIYWQKRLDSLALTYYHKALGYAIPEANYTVVGGIYESLTNYYKAKGNSDSALYYAIKTYEVVQSLGAVTTFWSRDINLGKVYQNLAMVYTMTKKIDSTNKYLQLALAVKDSLTASKINRLSSFQRLTLDQQIQLQEAERKRTADENKRRMYLLLAGIAVAFVIIVLIYRNNRQKQKAYDVLQKQKAETDLQKEKADAALQQLKATQSQLIQSEKMASLGELTAGIAHEIQNPLNFVNNFSEVSNELIDEMSTELDKGDIEEAKAIAADVKQNLEKINHHGKRADAIVKGMLQHSRTSTGSKELTDINALCDEYLRLAFHGLRAKDNTFNAKLETDFDEDLGKVDAVPQDIGRVLLNLINNAFYAVNEKAKQNQAGYEPSVSVSTKREAGKVIVTVADNGNGIPAAIKEKIFQPFFTTKPTGSGTGLGLSLSYDIITKGHGGELKLETKEGEGSVFFIQLPVVLTTD